MVTSTPNTATPPLLLSVSSADSTHITLHFDHDVSAGSGNFVISDGHSQSYVGANGLTTRIVGATDTRRLDDSDSQVTYSGHDVLIELSSALQSGLTYSITMDAGTVNETVSSAAIGRIGSTALFHFTTTGSASLPGTPAASVGASIHFTDTGASSSDYLTNAMEQTVTGSYNGSLQAGEFVQVSLDNGASWHKATVDGEQHTWSYSGVIATGNLTSGAGGNLNGTLLARVSNIDGGASATASQAYVYSNHTIPIEVNPTASFSADSGTANDLVTNVAAQTISGIYSGGLQVGQTLQVSVDAGAHWINATAADGSWHASGVTLLEGTHELQMRVIDGAGNASSTVYNDYTLISHGAALTGRALTLASGGDTGLSDSDGVTSTLSSLTLNVTGLHGLHAGDTFQVIDTSNNSAVVGSYTIQSNDLYYGGGDYLSVDYHNSASRASLAIAVNAGLDDGQHNLAVRLLDIAGNTGASSNSISLTLDTVAPTVALTTAQLQLGGNGQPVFAGGTEPVPALSNDVQPSIYLNLPTLAGYAVGDIIEIVDLNHSNAIVGHRTLLSGDLNPDHTLGKGILSVTLDDDLSDGLHTLAVKLADLAGNTLGLSDQHLNLTVDTTAPALSSSSPGANAGNVSPTDNIVLEFDENIRIDSSTQFTLSSGSGLITLSGSDLSVDGHTLTIHHAVLNHGAGYTLALSAGSVFDTAGNAAEVPSLSFSTAVDTDTPPPPTLISSIDISNDTGIDGADGVTKNPEQTLSGSYTGVLGGDAIKIVIDGDLDHVYDATVNSSDQTWSFDASAVFGANSNHSYNVEVYFASTPNVRISTDITIDTTTPTASLADAAAPTPYGYSAGTTIIRDTSPGISIDVSNVALAPGDVIELIDTDTGVVLDSRLLNGDAFSNGIFNGTAVTLQAGTLAADTYHLAMRVSDIAGNNQGHSNVLTLTIDPQTLPSMADSSVHLTTDTGIADDNITSDKHLTVALAGTPGLQNGDIIEVYDNVGTLVTTHTLTMQEVVDNGPISIALSTLGEGAHSLTVKVADAGGHHGASSSALAVTFDTTAPTASAQNLSAMLERSTDGQNAETLTPTFSVDLHQASGWAVGDVLQLVDAIGTHAELASHVITAADVAGAATGSYLVELTVGAGNYFDGTNYVVQVHLAQDLAGNIGSATDSAPTQVTMWHALSNIAVTLAPGSDTGVQGDHITATTTPSVQVDLSGLVNMRNGDLIKIIDTDNGNTVMANYTISGVDGNGALPNGSATQIMLNGALSAGTHHLAMQYYDADQDLNSQLSDAAHALTLTIDTTPLAQIVPSATSFDYTSAVQTITGQYSPASGLQNETVEVSLNNGASWQSATLGDAGAGIGSWSVTGSVSNGLIEVRIRDASGNLNNYSDSGRDIIVIEANAGTSFDTSSGSVPIFGGSGGNAYNLSEPTHNILSGGGGTDTVTLRFNSGTLPLSKLFGIDVIQMSPTYQSTTYGNNSIFGITPANVKAVADLVAGGHQLKINGDSTDNVYLGLGWGAYSTSENPDYYTYHASSDSAVVLLIGSAVGIHITS
jgi:hypothetical protein